MAKTLLVADSIWKSFAGRRVLQSASIRVAAHQIHALIGRNGAGKSTLLKITCGCLRADSGIVQYDGRRYARPRLGDLATRGLLFIPQDGFLSTAYTLRRQLEFFARRFSTEARQTCYHSAYEKLALDKLLESHPDQLSRGERRRAEIAIALIRRPACLVADEPFRGIAPIDIALVRSVLETLARQGAAVLVTGHEVSDLFEAAHQVTLCHSGTTLQLGEPAAAAKNDIFRREYLEGRWSAVNPVEEPR